jgi:tetratricopeptide (TPR) repeat protein
MIERFLDALAAAKLDLSAQEVADALWLASHMRFAVTPGEMPPGVTKLPTEPRSTTESPDEEREAKAGLEGAAEDARPTEVYLPLSQGTATGIHGRRGRAVQSPGVPALPGALGIARSLRPFKRRVPSRRHYLLDDEATVARIAEGGPKVPVLKPAPERWLELALVVDQSPTMVLWRQTLAELLRLLECHGAFRDVRLWSLTTDSDRILLQSGPGTGARMGNRSPRELVDPSGRRLIVVVSDCVSEAWHRGEMTTQALSIWARSGPLVLLQVLPERLWPRTGLAIASDAHLAGSLPGQSSHRLRVRGRRDQWRLVNPSEIALPVVTLEPRALAPWARMVAGLGGAWVPGKLLDFAAMATDDSEVGALGPSTANVPTAAQRTRRFRANASPTARKLAGYLAAAPLSLPAMRLVQAVMLPESRQVHLAEVFLGGILKQITSDVDVSPEEVQYEFEDGVRDLLLNEVRRSEMLQVLEEVSAWLDRQQGVKRGFRVLIEDPSSTEEIAISEGSRPFASVVAGVLRRLGLQQQAAPEFGPAISVGSMRGAPEPPAQTSSHLTAPPPAVQLVELERQAENLLGEANSGKSRGDAYLREGLLDEAEKAYRGALPIYQKISNRSGEADTQRMLGNTCFYMGRLSEAEVTFRAALAIYQELGQQLDEASTREALGNVYVSMGRLSEAENAYQSALPIYQRIKDRRGEADTQTALGDLYFRIDRLREAENAYQNALPIYQQIEDRRGEANTRQALGHLSARTDRLREAEEAYQSALFIYLQIEDRPGEADTRQGLGDLYIRTDRLREAEDAYQNALSSYQQIENRLGEANTQQALGDLYARLDRLHEAEKVYQNALSSYQQMADRLGEANTRQALGHLYDRTNRLREAEDAYQSALPIYQQVKDRLGEASTRQALGHLYIRTARLPEAEEVYQSALLIYKQIGQRFGEANTLWALGVLYNLAARLPEAEEVYQSALLIYQQIGHRLGEANTLQALGELYARTDRLRDAEGAYHSALSIYRQIENHSGEANTRKALDELYVRTDRLQKAEKVSQSLPSLYQQVDDRFGEANPSTVKAFIIYSHKDQKAFEQLQRFLRPLERDDLVTAWTDNRLAGGYGWRNKIDQALDEATVAVLLISQEFLSSDFIIREEVPRILAREAAGQLTVVPVFLSPSLVETVNFSNPRDNGRSKVRLSEFQGYGSPAEPLASLRRPERERVFADLARHLRSLSDVDQKKVAAAAGGLDDRGEQLPLTRKAPSDVGERGREAERLQPVRLGIRSMAGWGSDMTTRNDAVLDLVSFFDGRFIRQPGYWREAILLRLRDFLAKNVDPRLPVQLDIAAHSSIAFAAGWFLEAKSGLEVKVIQRVAGEGEMAWSPRDGTAGYGALWLERPDIVLSQNAPDVALALAVSQPNVAAEAEKFIRTQGLPVGRMVDATIAPAPGSSSVRGGAHALRLSQELLARLQRRAPHARNGALHFFFAAPNALLFYLGQLAHSLGRIVTYEYAFRSQDSYGRYQRAIELPPSL